MKTIDVAIIGAGLTGLATAYYAQKKGKTVAVIEKLDRTGGVIRTMTEQGFQFEAGPNTGTVGTPEIAELFEELHHECPAVFAQEEAKRRLVLKNGNWHALPNNLKTAIGTPLFSWYDKLRILGEPFRKKGIDENETLAQLVTRRLGKSYLDYAVDPFILGIYAGDPNLLATKYAMPKLYNLEQKYGSFVTGTAKLAKEKTERDKKATKKIFSFKRGMQQLTDSLTSNIGSENIILSANDISVSYQSGSFTIQSAKTGTNIKAGKLVSTVPSYTLPELLPFVPQHLMADIDNVEYAKVVQIALGWNKWEGTELKAFGGLIPHKENRELLGSLFMSEFLQNRSPQNGALMSIFMGGIRRPDIINWSDEQIKSVVEKEIKNLFRLNDFKPDLMKLFRYHHAIPQYGKSTKYRYAARTAIENRITNLYLRGNAFDGIGTADRIKQAQQTASIL